MPAAGGAPAQITRQGGTAAVESGDGFLYYAKRQGRRVRSGEFPSMAAPKFMLSTA